MGQKIATFAKHKLIMIMVFASIFIGLSAKGQVTSPACNITAYTTIPTGSTLIGTYSGNYYIAGPVTVSSYVTFNNCNLKMDPSASITLPTNTLLIPNMLSIINRTHIYCCGGMWQGIIVQTMTDGITISSNSLIEDAITAVTMGPKSIYDFKDAVFNKNNTGVSFLANTGPNPPPSNFRNVVFTSRDMLASYFDVSFSLSSSGFSSTIVKNDIMAGALTSANLNGLTTVAQIGISATNQLGIQLGDDVSSAFMNTFDNMNRGITLSYSNAIIYNNQFLNQNKNAAIGMANPIGVYAGANNNYNCSITVGGAGTNQSNIFNENLIGISINAYRYTYIYNNDMKNVITIPVANNLTGVGWKAIIVVPNDNSTTEIYNNIVTNYMFGIMIPRTTIGFNATDIVIDGNTVKSSNPPLVTTGYCKIGIQLNDNLQAVHMVTDQYKVRNNHVTLCYTGIIATNIQGGLVIHDNIVDLRDNGNITNSGIELQGCFKPRAINNTISSTASNVRTACTGSYTVSPFNVVPRYHGIWDNGSSFAEISCNTITGIGESMTFSNSTQGFNTIRNNSMSTGQHGMALRSSFVLGQQGDATHPIGQLWDVSAAGAFTQQTYVDQAPNSVNTTSVLFLDNVPVGTFITFPTLNYGALPANAYNATGLQPSVGAYFDCNNIFIQAFAGGGGGGEQMPAEQLIPLATDSTNYGGYTEELQYQNKTAAYSVLDNTNGAVTGDSTGLLQNLYDSVKVTTVGALKDVDNAIAVKDYSTADATNSGVAASNQIQANQKLINYYYLLKLNDENYQYTSSDSSAIYSVASQCQNEGGSIVWQARMMYFDIIGDRISFDDNCILMGKNFVSHSNTIAEENTSIKLYPNPNNGTMTLEYKIADSQSGIININDITGKQIKSIVFKGSNTSISIDASELGAGVYLYDVMINNTKVNTDRLVIIK